MRGIIRFPQDLVGGEGSTKILQSPPPPTLNNNRSQVVISPFDKVVIVVHFELQCPFEELGFIACPFEKYLRLNFTRFVLSDPS